MTERQYNDGEVAAIFKRAAETEHTALPPVARCRGSRPKSAVPADVKCERDYRALRVRGPLPLNLIGVLASIAGPLADAGISIFAISTFDTDYVLVKGTDLDKAVATLTRAGHHVTRL